MHIYSSHCVRWLLSGLRYIWGFGLVVLLHRAVEALIANMLIKTTNLVLLGNAQLQQQICLKNMLDLVMSKAEIANCTCDMMLLEPRKSIDIRSCSAPAYRNPSWLQPPTTKKKGTRTVSWLHFCWQVSQFRWDLWQNKKSTLKFSRFHLVTCHYRRSRKKKCSLPFHLVTLDSKTCKCRILTWEPATARKKTKKWPVFNWQIHLMPLFHVEFFVSHFCGPSHFVQVSFPFNSPFCFRFFGPHHFFKGASFSLGFFCVSFLGPCIFFLMSSLLLAFLFPIFPIFLDATFSLGVFCFPFFGSHFRCHIFLLPFLLPNFWSQSFF